MTDSIRFHTQVIYTILNFLLGKPTERNKITKKKQNTINKNKPKQRNKKNPLLICNVM